jgi:RNA recognition motif-containing protein
VADDPKGPQATNKRDKQTISLYLEPHNEAFLKMKKLFVGNLPSTTTDESLQALFSEFGKVHTFKLVKDLFTGSCKGFGFIEMEGHEARAAITGLDGRTFEGNTIKVKYEEESKKGGKGRR